LDCSLTLKMEAVSSSKMLVNFYWITQHYNLRRYNSSLFLMFGDVCIRMKKLNLTDIMLCSPLKVNWLRGLISQKIDFSQTLMWELKILQNWFTAQHRFPSFISLNSQGRMRLSPLGASGNTGSIVSAPGDENDKWVWSWWNEKQQREQKNFYFLFTVSHANLC
jgi:hypothetical protein